MYRIRSQTIRKSSSAFAYRQFLQPTLQRASFRMSSNDAGEQPPQQGLIGGHVKYIRGATEETIGRMSGSESWKTSGEQNKANAIRSMQKATEKRVPNRDGYGRVEEMVGNLTGCEGMQKEGAASKREQ